MDYNIVKLLINIVKQKNIPNPLKLPLEFHERSPNSCIPSCDTVDLL